VAITSVTVAITSVTVAITSVTMAITSDGTFRHLHDNGTIVIFNNLFEPTHH
jgi:hypothetical protein